MEKIGLAPNPKRKEAVDLTAELIPWLIKKNIKPIVIEEVAQVIGYPQLAASNDAMHNVDLLLVLGGDGTMLRWCRIVSPYPTPIIGVNFGKYGFITELSAKNIKQSLTQILDGKYTISDRVPLQAKLTRDGKLIHTYYGFNDIVISRGVLSRVIELETYIGGQYIVTYAADGIIISTPIGSTGYSLSAGGPVVHPDLKVFIITPICPHTLNARPLVVSNTEAIGIMPHNCDSNTKIMLTVDGQTGETISNDDRVDICSVDFTARFVQLTAHSFYDKLRGRLRWGERFKL